jgi:osmotically-inducible protein OsmY
MVAMPTATHRTELPLAARVSHQLQSTGRSTLQAVCVQERQGTVVLSGRVPTFYAKQLAQTIAASVDGVSRVCNETTVAPLS